MPSKVASVPIEYSEQEISGVVNMLQGDIRPGVSIGLIGDLGAGKTTLVRALLNTCGVSVVSSPTFSLLNEYVVSSHLTIEHWDIYRLASAPEELFERVPHHSARIIEWADRDPRLLEELDYRWTISLTSDSPRRILHREVNKR
jgi:tRNA threonylcarbamoyladenosine biosynthesis protein TsaE